jgi:hypothetical protein
MSKLILHVGAHKTGTTSVQHSLWLNRELLAKHGVIYPDIGPGRGHAALTAIWRAVPRLPNGFFATKGPEQILGELAEQHRDGDETLVLSSEAFSHLGEAGVDMADLRHRVEGFDEIRVVCVLREQLGWMQSLYLQVAKQKPIAPFREYFKNIFKPNHVAALRADFNNFYDRLLAGFTPEEVSFADFDELRAAPGGLIGFFLDQIGVNLSPDDLKPLPKNRNVSPDPLAWFVAKHHVAPRIPGGGQIAAAKVTLAETFGAEARTTLYTRAEAAELDRHIKPLNTRLEERVRPIQPDFRITRKPPALDLVYREDIDDALHERFAETLAERRRARQETPGDAGAAAQTEKLSRKTLRRRKRGQQEVRKARGTGRQDAVRQI